MRGIKRISAFWMTLLVGILCCLSVFASEQRVFDQAGLFEDTEISELESRVSDLREKYSFDIVVVTTDDAKGKSAARYADDYYDDHGFGGGAERSGVLFLIDMDNREAYISTTGSARRLYDSRIEEMLDAVFGYLPDGDYYHSAVAFLEQAAYYAEQGVPVDGYTEDDGSATEAVARISLPWAIVTIALALVAGGGFFLVVFLRYNRRGKQCPYPFRQQSKLELIHSEDNYLGTTMTSRQIETSDDNSSGSGGSGGGGGGSHGGGGRSF